MLKEKQVLDVINRSRAKLTIIPQIKKKDKNNVITAKIIKQRVNTDLYINIIREKNLQRFWKMLCQVCLHVG